jgi:hypothetical protein
MRFGYRAGDGEIDFDTEQHWGQYHVVSPRFFEVLGVPLLAGRGFDARDRDGSLPVVVINEALERTHFGGEAVGREMIVVGTRRQIVGVVGSVRHFGFDRAAPPEMYVPLAQDPWLNGHVLVRAGESYSAEDLRQVVASIDARVPAPALIPYEDLVRGWFAPLRFQLVIVTLLAMAGGVLAVVGLYALIAFVVAGSTREIGIRAALGEKSSAAFARVAGRGVALAAAGTAIGCAAAWAVRGVVLSFDTGVTAYSPTAVGLVVTLVIAAAGIACAVPARRAARVDPVTALRAE